MPKATVCDWEVAAEKTNLIRFDRQSKFSFEFLGFEFSWGRGRSGNIILKRRTSRKKYRAALANLTAWCPDCLVVCPSGCCFRNGKPQVAGLLELLALPGQLRESERLFLLPATTTLLKCLNHRSQKRSYTSHGFRALLRDFPLAKPRICHAF
ncbi:MAG: hypothetical protein ACRESZ_21915 [Methylococcales bacterium]